jgi:endonuclease G
MKARAMQHVVDSTAQRLPEEKIEELLTQVRSKTPPDLVEPRRMSLRRARLEEAEVRPSAVAQERILGTNDLVDVIYLLQALNAARSVGRVVLRNRAGREIGYGTGFKVAPGVLLTNHHVLETDSIAATSLVEFDYELDETGSPRATTRFALDPGGLYLSDPTLDFALVAIKTEPIYGQGQLENYSFLRMIREEGKINPGEFVTIIQHPSGLPKQIALRENKLLSIEDLVIWYQSDTAQGSSGAPVFNDSWQIVALHHSGVPKKDAQGNWLLKNGQPAGPDAEDGDIDWRANEGIRASRIAHFVEMSGATGPYLDQFRRASSGELQPAGPLFRPPEGPPPAPTSAFGMRYESVPGGTRVTVPISFTVTVEGIPPTAPPPPAVAVPPVKPDVAVEGLKKVLIDQAYDNRKGYDPDFLGIEVPLPEVRDESRVAKMGDGQHALPYQNFSVVMDKARRLALFTASNIDASPEKQEPEPGRDYSRKGLGGLTQHQSEMWSTDPRIPARDQLPDRFYTQDDQAFDKGHLARRDAVAWGDTYDEVRRANGDSFHTTNCSPQVADFNRGNLGGLWGRLEDVILAQADTEKLCIFSGPLLQDDDRTFVGKDEQGDVRIQIPSVYWKIVVAQAGDEIQSFGFILEQDLSNVPLEFAVEAPWLDSMISIAELESLIGSIRFPKAVVDGDQFQTPVGEEVLQSRVLPGIRRQPLRVGSQAAAS